MSDTKISFLQINLNKSKAATENALQISVELAVDIIIVQEPYLTQPIITMENTLDYS